MKKASSGIAFSMALFVGAGIMTAAPATAAETPIISNAIIANPQDKDPNYIRWRVLNLVNEHRAVHAVPLNSGNRRLLRTHEVIQNVSQAWADHLVTTETTQHNPQWKEQLEATGMFSFSGAENISSHTTLRDPGYVSHRNFLNSASHKANMEVASWTHVGVGVAFGASGRIYVVVNFGQGLEYEDMQAGIYPSEIPAPLVNNTTVTPYNWSVENPHPNFRADNPEFTPAINARNTALDEYYSVYTNVDAKYQSLRSRLSVSARNEFQAAWNAFSQKGEYDLSNDLPFSQYLQGLKDHTQILTKAIQDINEAYSVAEQSLLLQEEINKQHQAVAPYKEYLDNELNPFVEWAEFRAVDRNLYERFTNAYNAFSDHVTQGLKNSIIANWGNDAVDLKNEVEELRQEVFLDIEENYIDEEEGIRNEKIEFFNELYEDHSTLMNNAQMYSSIYSGKVLDASTIVSMKSTLTSIQSLNNQSIAAMSIQQLEERNSNLEYLLQMLDYQVKMVVASAEAYSEKTNFDKEIVKYNNVYSEYTMFKKDAEKAIKDYTNKVASNATITNLKNLLNTANQKAVGVSTLKTYSDAAKAVKELENAIVYIPDAISNVKKSNTTWVETNAINSAKKKLTTAITAYNTAYKNAEKTYKNTNKKVKSNATRTQLNTAMNSAKAAAKARTNKTAAQYTAQAKAINSAVKTMNSKRDAVLLSHAKFNYSKSVTSFKKESTKLGNAIKAVKKSSSKKTATYKNAVSYKKSADKLAVSESKLKTVKALDSQRSKLNSAKKKVTSHTTKVKKLKK